MNTTTALVCLLLAGCGGAPFSAADPTPDASPDSPVLASDGGSDAPAEAAGPDGGPEAAAPPDAGKEASPSEEAGAMPDAGCLYGETRCAPGGVNGVETCQGESGWSSPVLCVGKTCLDVYADGGMAGVCSGVCAPGKPTCDFNQPVTCSATGQWVDAGPACPEYTKCVGTSGGTSCTTTCGNCLTNADCETGCPPADAGTNCCNPSSFTCYATTGTSCP